MPLTPRSAGHRRTRIEVSRAGFFLALVHVVPIAGLLAGPVAADWATFAGVHVMLALLVGTGLHRYFAHHAFQTSRAFQFVLALGTCLTFTDPIGFSGKHRIHHRYSDSDDDVHSPDDGWWSCWIWSLADDGLSDGDVIAAVPDLARVPELMFLHRWFWVPGLVFAGALYAIGGFTRMAIGYVFALVLLLHLTSAVNYVCHRWGTRRYSTRDASRNNALVAALTWGEGWHNNHHYYPGAARAGFAWWEIDVNYLVIRALATVRLVWAVRDVPTDVRRIGGLS